MMKKIIVILFCCLSVTVGRLSADIGRGEGMFVYKDSTSFADRPVDIHYYIPLQGDITAMPIIFVFHGADRGYDYLVRTWKVAAEQQGFMVFIPQFDKERFPLCDYQEVGVMNREHTRLISADSITPVLIDRIFENVKLRTGSYRNTYNIYGHSAGGQFIHRMMLFHDSPYVDCAVVGSPGWYTFPDTSCEFPYGVGDIAYVTSERIKKYLSKNIVIQLAPCDSVREWFLRKTPEADAQGLNRYERGISFWNYCRRLAAENNVPFNWRKSEVPDVGHVSEAMGMAAVPYLIDIKEMPDMARLRREGEEYMSVVRYMDDLKRENDSYVHVDTVNSSTPIMVLSKKGGADRKAKVWLQGALHGNEPAGAYVLCVMARRIIDSGLLDRMDVAIVPVANPDGYRTHRRTASGTIDLNRDFTKLVHKQTEDLSRAFARFSPDLAMDIHEYNPRRKEFASYLGRVTDTDYDVLFLPSGHLNIDNGIKSLISDLYISSAREALNDRLYSSDIYFTPVNMPDGEIRLNYGGDSPRSTSTRWALGNTLSIFVEIKGIGMGPDTFNRRVECGLTVVDDVLNTLYENIDLTLAAVDDARRKAVEGEADVAVGFTRGSRVKNVRLRDMTTGKDSILTFPAYDALSPVATSVVKRPSAYIVKDAEGGVRRRLSAMGIEWQAVNDGTVKTVDAYHVNDVMRDTEEWEGIRRTEVSVMPYRIKREFNKEYITVPVRQPMGNLVVTLLEPESKQGFVNFGVIPVGDGGELPVYQCRP